MEEICKVQSELSADDALQLLCDELLGEKYYIADPVNGKQANAIIALEILKRYAPKKKKRW
jgi:hypothetical protein